MVKLPDGREVEKTCPKCGPTVKMIVRTNRKSETQFLGCPNWPDCDHTEEIPPALIAEANGQPKLF